MHGTYLVLSFKDGHFYDEQFNEDYEDDAQKESEQYEHIAGLFEELKLYRELGTVKEFKELKKKNETKKLKVLKSFDEEYGASWCSCPNCARGIG